MKRSRVVKHIAREIADLLESDDELPDTYDETPEIPAYLKDDRFTKAGRIGLDEVCQSSEEITMQTKAIYQQSTVNNQLNTDKKDSEQCQNICQESAPGQTLYKSTKLISTGILTKRDIFLIQSIEEYITDATLLWFIDFLNYKFMNLPQRSCLVADIMNDGCPVQNEPIADFNYRYLKLVVNSTYRC